MSESVFDGLLADVVDEAMRDWGRPIVLVRERRVYAPESGEIQVEEVERVETEAIISEGSVAGTKGTATAERTSKTVALVRAGDFGDGSVAGCRVVLDGVRFDVVEVEKRGGGVVGLSIVETTGETVENVTGAAA